MYELITNTQLWIAVLGSSLLVKIFDKVFDLITGKRKVERVLLLQAIEEQSDKIVAQGFRTHDQTKRIQEAYELYKKIGGDGYADSLLADAMAKPTQE